MDLKRVERKCLRRIEFELNSFCKLVLWRCVRCCHAQIVGYGDYTLNAPSDLLSQIFLALCFNDAVEIHLPFSDCQFNGSILQLGVLMKGVFDDHLDFQVRDALGEPSGLGIRTSSWINDELIVE